MCLKLCVSQDLLAMVNTLCPSNDSNCSFVDWIDLIRNNKVGIEQNFFINHLQVITIAWTIWKHRNNVIFRYHMCHPAYILESTMRTSRSTIQYNFITNKLPSINETGKMGIVNSIGLLLSKLV